MYGPGFPGGSALKNPPAAVGDTGMQVQSLGWEDPLEKKMGTCSSILSEKSHGQRKLAGYGPWGHKESDLTEQLTLSLFRNITEKHESIH